MFEHITRVLKEEDSLIEFDNKQGRKTAASHWGKILLYSVLFSSFFIPAHARVQQDEYALFQRFEERFCLLDSLIFLCNTSNKVSAAAYDYEKSTPSMIDSRIDNKVQKQQEALLSESGILLSGQTYHRSGEGAIDSDEDDALSNYHSKVQIELRWNILASSLHNQEGRLNELLLEGELEHAHLEQEQVAIMIERQKQSFREEYDSLLGGILQLRIENLQLLNDAQSYLASDRSIGIDDLLKIMDEQAIAERLLTTIPKEYPAASQLVSPHGAIIHLDTTRLKKNIRENTLPLRVIDLEIKLLRQREKNTKYTNSLNLSPFLRYSYYIRNEVKSPSNIDIGIAFQIPILGQEPGKRKVLAAERLQKIAEKDELAVQLMTEVETLLTEVERANRGLQGELKRIEKLRMYMKQRRHDYQGHIGEYNFMSRIKEYNHYLTCWENYYSYQYKRDCYIADLQAFLSKQSIVDFCIIQK